MVSQSNVQQWCSSVQSCIVMVSLSSVGQGCCNSIAWQCVASVSFSGVGQWLRMATYGIVRPRHSVVVYGIGKVEYSIAMAMCSIA